MKIKKDCHFQIAQSRNLKFHTEVGYIIPHTCPMRGYYDGIHYISMTLKGTEN